MKLRLEETKAINGLLLAQFFSTTVASGQSGFENLLNLFSRSDKLG